jgi:hypothetical protein
MCGVDIYWRFLAIPRLWAVSVGHVHPLFKFFGDLAIFFSFWVGLFFWQSEDTLTGTDNFRILTPFHLSVVHPSPSFSYAPFHHESFVCL